MLKEKQHSKNAKGEGESTNTLKHGLLSAIKASSDEDFDILDVLYVVAKTCKDQYTFNKENAANFIKKSSNKKRKTKRSVNSFEKSSLKDVFLPQRSERSYTNISNASFEATENLFGGNFPPEEMQSKFVNPFNVPVNDQFLGIFAIPTNQAYAVIL